MINEVSGYAVTYEPLPFAPVGIDLSRIDDKIAKYPTGWGARADYWRMRVGECHSAIRYTEPRSSSLGGFLPGSSLVVGSTK